MEIILAILLLLICVALFVYLVLPREMLPSIISDVFNNMRYSPYWKLGVVGSAVGGLFALAAIIMCAYGARIWLVIVVLSCSLILPYRTVVLPYQNLERQREEVGQRFRRSIPAGENPDVVYKMYNVPPCYSEMHYFDIKLKTIESAKELPEDRSVVYVFSRVVPSAPDRAWERVSSMFYRNNKIELWRGKLKTEEDYE